MHELALALVIQVVLHHLAGRLDGKIGNLVPQFLEGGLLLPFDLGLGLLLHLLDAIARLGDLLFTELLGRLARLSEDALRLALSLATSLLFSD